MSERGSRVRRLAGRTSGKQRVGLGVAIVLLLTAPFGGLRAAAESPVAKVRAEKAVEVGPLRFTVQKVVTVGDLAPEARPSIEGNRLLAFVGTLKNPGRRPAGSTTLTGALHVQGAGVVDAGHGGLSPTLLSYDDGQNLSVINPGLTYKVVLLYEQERGWAKRPIRLDVDQLTFVHEDPLTLDADFWLDTDRTAASGTFAVEVRR